jgi:choline dehydrogenase-like flavoprotein
MIYMRGQAADHGVWRQLGLDGWGWDDVLPYFLRHEDRHGGPSEFHGAGGEWRIERPRIAWPILDTARDAGVIGVPKVHDFNRVDNEGSENFEINQRRGRRWSAATAFVKPILRRPNLIDHAHAETILFEQGRVVDASVIPRIVSGNRVAHHDVAVRGAEMILANAKAGL